VPIDVDAARALTPGVQQVTHLNNAGASLSPTPVLETVVGHLRREAEIGGYEAADEAADRLAAVYRSVADLVGAAGPDEIALVDNATRAWDLAFYAIDFQPGDRILTGRAEYASNALAMLQVVERTGAVVELVEDDGHGQIDLDALERAFDDDVRLVALTHVPTNNGLVNPADEVGALAARHHTLFLLDACQSVGQLPIDVQAIGCHLACATGRKFLRGPRGTGFLYARADVAEALHPPLIDLHAAVWTGERSYQLAPGAQRFETWERSIAGLLGLGTAVDLASSVGLAAIADRVQGLAARLRAGLAEVPGVTVRDRGEQLSAIATFTLDGVEAAELSGALRAQTINTSVSYERWARLNQAGRGIGDLVRASPHYFTTEDEVDRLVEAVRHHRR